MTHDVIYISADNVITYDKAKDVVNDTFLNSATVTVTLKDSAGGEVSGETWPLTMSYVAASDGKYQAVLDDSLVLTEDSIYYAEISLDAGSDLKDFRRLKYIAAYRTTT